MSKVYIVTEVNSAIQSAKHWGDLVTMTSEPINPFSIDRLAWTLAPSLNNFNDNDHLLLTGPGIGHIISTIAIYSRRESAKLLRYEPSTQGYVELVLNRDAVWNQLYFSEPTFRPGRIFALNFSGHDFRPAEKFSDHESENKMVFITKGNVDQFDIDRLISDAASKLSEFQEGDLLLLSGPAILHVIATLSLMRLCKRFGVLIYNPKRRIYIRREVNVQHIAQIGKLAETSNA